MSESVLLHPSDELNCNRTIESSRIPALEHSVLDLKIAFR